MKYRKVSHKNIHLKHFIKYSLLKEIYIKVYYKLSELSTRMTNTWISVCLDVKAIIFKYKCRSALVNL